MKFLAQRLLDRYQPRLVIFIGKHGKSMAMAASNFLLRANNLTPTLVENVQDITKAVVPPPQILKACLQAVGLKPFPSLFLWELQPQEDVSLLAGRDVTVVITSPCDPEWLQQFLAQARPKQLIINLDGQELPEFSKKDAPQVFTYAIDQAADYQAEFIELVAADEAKLTGVTDPRWRGMQSKVKYKGSVLPLRLSGGLGRTHVYSALAATAVGEVLDVHVLDALKTLREFMPLPGRMTLVPAIKKGMVIDDSYDMDVMSALLAFDEAASVPMPKDKKRFAFVGELSGVGSDSADQHRMLGKALAGMGYQVVIGVGEKTADLLRGSEESGLKREQLFHFLEASEAAKFLQREMKRGELIVVKGSASQKLESAVKELMAFPLRAKTDLLQR